MTNKEKCVLIRRAAIMLAMLTCLLLISTLFLAGIGMVSAESIRLMLPTQIVTLIAQLIIVKNSKEYENH